MESNNKTIIIKAKIEMLDNSLAECIMQVRQFKTVERFIKN